MKKLLINMYSFEIYRVWLETWKLINIIHLLSEKQAASIWFYKKFSNPYFSP